jgi:hypothetical protein
MVVRAHNIERGPDNTVDALTESMLEQLKKTKAKTLGDALKKHERSNSSEQFVFVDSKSPRSICICCFVLS